MLDQKNDEQTEEPETHSFSVKLFRRVFRRVFFLGVAAVLWHLFFDNSPSSVNSPPSNLILIPAQNNGPDIEDHFFNRPITGDRGIPLFDGSVSLAPGHENQAGSSSYRAPLEIVTPLLPDGLDSAAESEVDRAAFLPDDLELSPSETR